MSNATKYALGLVSAALLGAACASGARTADILPTEAETAPAPQPEYPDLFPGLDDWLASFEARNLPIENRLDQVEDDQSWYDLALTILRENGSVIIMFDMWQLHDGLEGRHGEWSKEILDARHELDKYNSALLGQFSVFRESMMRDPEKLSDFREKHREGVIRLTQQRRYLMYLVIRDRIGYGEKGLMSRNL